MKCPVCGKDFPVGLLSDLVVGKGGELTRTKMCPICGLKRRNIEAGLAPDTPFQGLIASNMHKAALQHLERTGQ